jgi:hypothetical protein
LKMSQPRRPKRPLPAMLTLLLQASHFEKTDIFPQKYWQR